MKTSLKIVLAFLFTLISLFAIYFLRIVPSVKIWDSYKIFYVDKSVDIETVFSNSTLMNKIISKSTQNYPTSNKITPIMGEYTLRNFTSQQLRDVFFEDMDSKYQLFYVKNDIAKSVADFLNSQNIAFGTDNNATVPIVCPIVCFVLITLLWILSKSKFRFFVGKLPFVLMAYAMPYYSVGIAICCFISFYFVAELFLVRKDWKISFVKQPILIILGIISITLIFMCGLRAIILFLLALISSFSLLIIFSSIPNKNLYGFFMKEILPSRYINKKKRINVKYFCLSLISVIVLFIFFIISSNFVSDISENNLFLPAPSEYTDGDLPSSLEENYKDIKSNINLAETTNELVSVELPNVFDFVDEKWILQTYPYQILDLNFYESISFGDVISFPTFSKTSNGLVKQDYVNLFSFDENFVSSSISEFEKSNGIEQLLVSQKPYTNITYSSGGKAETTVLMWIVSFLGLFFLGCITSICLVKRHIK